MQKLELSLIIPAYNEERRIDDTLKALESFVRSVDFSLEILLVSDGSTDNTVKRIKTFLQGRSLDQFRVIELVQNRGKGAAIKRGVELANGAVIGFTDADLPYGLDEVPDILKSLSNGGELDAVIGARDLPGSKMDSSVPFVRFVAGRVYRLLVRSVLHLGMGDTQCGFKFFTRAAAKAIFAKITIEGFGFDVEVIHTAKVNNFRIRRIPMTLISSHGSSVRVVSDSLKMLRELILIRFRDVRNFYQLESASGDAPHANASLATNPPTSEAPNEAE